MEKRPVYGGKDSPTSRLNQQSVIGCKLNSRQYYDDHGIEDHDEKEYDDYDDIDYDDDDDDDDLSQHIPTIHNYNDRLVDMLRLWFDV